MRYVVINLGCKVNRVESDSFERILLEQGAVPGSLEEADLVVVNTCAVTAEAEKKTRKTVRKAVRSSRGPVIVTGCSAVLHEEVYLQMDERVSAVAKGAVDDEIARIVEELGEKGMRAEAAPASCEAFAEKPAPQVAGDFAQRARVGVKVQDGCNNACTYCVIHVARGPAWSVPVPAVEADCRRLVAAGVREIVLTGINLGTYRQQMGEETLELADLLERLLPIVRQVPGCVEGGLGCRIRLSSIEPTDLSLGLVALLAREKGRICRHLHLPLQSGSCRVLAQMNRPYTAEEYLDVVRAVREAVPQVSLTTDIIVGFPGETEEDFQETLDLARECGFSRIHVFPYSRREGTPAAERADQVPDGVKADRARRLRALAAELAMQDRAQRDGTWEWALVEVPGEAMTESYHGVSAPEGAQVGELVRVPL